MTCILLGVAAVISDIAVDSVVAPAGRQCPYPPPNRNSEGLSRQVREQED